MNSVLIALLHPLAVFVAGATLLAILFPRRPVLGIPQHWGLQLWQLGLIGLIGGILLLDRAAVVLCLLCAAYWSWRLWPRRAPEKTPDSEPLLRLVSANLLHQN